jgi:hypothetical protein
LQIFDGVEKRIESTTTNGDTLPTSGESDEGALLDGFDFTAKASQAFAANLLENFGVAPFLMLAARAEFAFEKFAATVECAKSGVYRGRLKGVARGQFMSGEWAVGTGVTAENFASWIVGGRQKNFGEAGWQRSADGVAITRGVFDGHKAEFAGDADAYGAAGVDEIGDGGGNFRSGRARDDFGFGEIAEFEEKIVEAVGVAGLIFGFEGLEAAFDFVDGSLIEQFA